MALAALRSYRDPIDAGLDQALLDAAGIPSVMLNENLVGIQWLYSNAIGGVKLQVDDSQLALARDVLDRDDSPALESVAENRLPPVDGDICPSCGSSKVQRSRLRKNTAAISLGLGLPLIAW